MTKLFYILIVSLLFTACTGDAFNQTKCMSSVQAKHPGAIIFAIPKQDYKFIVIDSVNVMYVETLSGKTSDITASIIISKH